MKFLITLMLLFCAGVVTARNFYISATGNDASDGLSPATAWKTIAKLNASFNSIAPGDAILFKSDESFYGSIIIGKSGSKGNPITIGSYGTGAKPIITGFNTLSSWTFVSPGIYQAAVNCKYSVNLLTMNGVPQRIGRYPNYDAPNGGYLTWTAYSGNTSVTAAGLNGTNWTGADIIIRKEGYLLERDSVTGQSGGTVSYKTYPSINPRNDGNVQSAYGPARAGYGLFIQNDIRTLDLLGEWYFNTATGMMNVFFGANTPSDYTVNTSTVDTLININNKSFITINNLDLQGANLAAVYYENNQNVTVRNTNIIYSGSKGIFGWNSPNGLIESCTINYSANGGIDIMGRYASNETIQNNVVKNSGIFQGMGSGHNVADYAGIHLSVDNIGLIRKNRVDSSGYAGIYFQGSNMVIDSNYINYYGFVKDDVGGIYTFSTLEDHRVIKNNIVLNGIGAPGGNAAPPHCEGFYSDGGARGCTVYNNTFAYINNRALYFNDPKDIDAQYNTVYSTGAIAWCANKHYNDSIYNFTLKHNIFFKLSTTPNNGQVYFNSGVDASSRPVVSGIQPALQRLGNIDSNHYQFAAGNNKQFYWYHKTNAASNYVFPPAVNLAGWKAYTGHDANSDEFSSSTIGTDIFLYNASDAAKTISLNAVYVDVDSTVYSGKITLQPFTSAILIKSGELPPALKADAGTDITIVLPKNSVTLKGSANATIIKYSWTKIAGPAQYTILNSNGASTLITNLSMGRYTFLFKVINSAGDSAMATVNVIAAGVLPVKLIEFTAENNNTAVALQWKSASEINVSHYTIERSGDGKSFENVGQLNANNLRDIQINYNFSDNFPLKGINYYRLVMIDKDGTFSYSKTVAVTIKNASSFSLDNIALSSINSTVKVGVRSNYQQVLQLVVADVNGRIIYTKPLQLQKGINIINNKIPALNTGIYYTKLFTNDQVVTRAVLSGQ